MKFPVQAAATDTVGLAMPRDVARETTAQAGHRPRLDSIDLLRGWVMVIMVLDHVRDYLAGGAVDPRDVHDPVLFLTRWITHFCAPVFVMLSGVSAYLYGARGRTTHEIARFLATRGLWLIFIELTLVRFAFTFDPSYDFMFLQVIWVIGCAMVLLAALVYLPRWVIGAFGLVLIVGHNALDGIRVEAFGDWQWLWVVLHQPGMLQPSADTQMLALYALIPWVGVMAVGYALGPVFRLEAPQRRKALMRIGLAVIALFVVLRATNLYGDPRPWAVQDGVLATLLSFVNCEKYPPSLLYLAMTLGPACIVLALYEAPRGALGRAVLSVGRVPFLFYVAHIFVVHAFAILVAAITGHDVAWLFQGMPPLSKPAGYGVTLPTVYAMWIIALLILYPLCFWFGEIKQRRKDWWLSYL